MLNLPGVRAPSAFVFYPNPHESQKLKSYILLDARKGLTTSLLSERERGREREEERESKSWGESHSGRQSHLTVSTVRSQTT